MGIVGIEGVERRINWYICTYIYLAISGIHATLGIGFFTFCYLTSVKKPGSYTLFSQKRILKKY
ncbi:unknown protein [Microcystis aeruginosa NIES-843]|uniref:Uncharacterized protein n=1 Tax=Microcystis aeruginosa (strain NIES-843 / IAM M-2473) TaxID=449447 RepID=B0JS68_MICAN|nr:unknown protein [Microcystis aeruginosa NIES-843]